MQLNLFRDYQSRFHNYLSTPAAERRLYAYEAQRRFQENWELPAENFAAMYDRSLQNTRSRRLWRAENYNPKDMVFRFLQENPDYARHAFNDLFNDEKDLDGRCGRFVFYMDELLKMHRDAHPRSIQNNHYHDDYRMVFLYLAFRYPERYALYHFRDFRTMLEKLRARTPPKTHDPERFGKVMRTCYKLLSKDEDLMEAHRKRLDPELDYTEESLLICWEFYRFVAEH